MDKISVSQRYFGFSEFRAGQEEIIDSLLSGQDAFAIMPTGVGKSICYQVPALMMDDVTFVISPLISLMKDQVNALTSQSLKVGISESLVDGCSV